MNHLKRRIIYTILYEIACFAIGSAIFYLRSKIPENSILKEWLCVVGLLVYIVSWVGFIVSANMITYKAMKYLGTLRWIIAIAIVYLSLSTGILYYSQSFESYTVQIIGGFVGFILTLLPAIVIKLK